MTKFSSISLINYFLHMMFIITIMLFIMNMNNHPITIMIILLMYTLMTCMNMSLWKSNYIFSIFLFLMMISGLLIIFLYFSSLISNAKFKIKINLTIIIIFLINMNLSLYFLLKSNSLSNLYMFKYKFHENSSIMKINKMTFNNILNLYEYPLTNWTALSMFYLLFVLFIIIKICSTKSSTLRKIN